MSGLKILDLEEISLKQLTQLSLDCRVFVKRLKETKIRRKKRKTVCYKRAKTNKTTSTQQYWAQSIEECRINSENELLFLIKWENYSHCANTWQSVRDLFQCDLLFNDFFLRLFTFNNDVTLYQSEQLDHFSRVISELSSDCCDLAIVFRLNPELSLDKKEELKKFKQKLELWSRALRRARRVSEIWYKRILLRHVILELELEKNFENFEEFLEFCEKRKEILLDLKKWENDINRQMIASKEPSIKCENHWDCEVPPPLEYVTKNLISSNLLINPQLVDTRCECLEDCQRNRNCFCALKLYRDNRRFKTSHVIYECNSSCKCGITCPNRRIQRGRETRLTVFRTRDRGWGVLTRQRIQFGDFVFEYNGEVLDSRDTRSRDSTYFFNIDSEFCGQTLFVDGKRCGNITRFANHSCDPNLDVHLAFVNGLDRVPRIAFFAKRRIEANEELSYDYKRNVFTKDSKTGEYVTSDNSDSGYDSNNSKTDSDSIKCFCNSKNCKKFI